MAESIKNQIVVRINEITAHMVVATRDENERFIA